MGYRFADPNQLPMAKKYLPLILSDEEIQAVEDLAAVGYAPEKIALYLDRDKKQFLQEWYDHESDIREAYNRGQLRSDFLVAQKQKQLAESGNITAAQIFLKLQQETEVKNIRNQVLFGGHEDPYEGS